MAQNSIKKIAVLGAESTGKTWLCEALAKHYATAWVPEYAREYFNDSDIYNYTLNDLEIIAKKQMELEHKSMGKAHGFLFCDTALITLKIWAELEFNKTPAVIEEQIKKIKYDHYFITDNQIAWTKDPLRQNKFSRELILQMNQKEVEQLGATYSFISGKNNERLENAVAILERMYFNR